MRTRQAITLFLLSRQAKGLSPDTIRWYSGILNKFADKFHDFPESPSDIDGFLATLNVGDERRHGYYRALRCFYRLLYKRHDVINLFDKIEAPRRTKKQPRPLTPDELDQLLRFPHKAKIKAALLLLIDTGCRVSEAASVQLNDITDTPWGFVVRITGKTGSRLVPISNYTYRALTKSLPFCLTKYKFRRDISKSFQEAHVLGSGIRLRHTFGTLWEGDELALQQIMGHANLSTTRIYRAMRTEYLSKQHYQYSPLRMVLTSSKELL